MALQNTHLIERAKKAEVIIASPAEYKVCEGCESIVREQTVTCPSCHGYRFEDAPQAVVAQARLLASREQRSVCEEDLF